MVGISKLGEKFDLSQGTWVNDVDGQPGLRLKVRSVNFKPFQVAVGGVARRSGKQMRTDEGFAEYIDSAGKPMAEHLLTDWDFSQWTSLEAITHDDGSVIEYSKEMALAILTGKDDLGVCRAFRTAVNSAAEQVADGLLTAAKEAAGN